MRFKLIALLLFVLCQQSWAVAKIENWSTSQGARVYFVQTPSLPMLDVRIAFDAGSARDDNRFGLAALTLSMLGNSSGEWSADQVAERFEAVGALFGNGISEDMAWLSLRSLNETALFDKAFDVFKQVVTHPAFAATDFQREKNLTLAGLKQREESPAAVASQAYRKALYPDHPYGHLSDGTLETVNTIELSQVQDFYKRYYVAANALVVIVGDASRAQAQQIAENLLVSLPVGEKPAELPPVVLPDKASMQQIAFPSTQTHVLSGMPGNYRKDPDYFPLYVGNHILGGGNLVSRLFNEVREKRGLAYSASSQFNPLYRPGPFTLGLQTRNDQTEQALTVMNATLHDFIADGPNAKELLAAKQNITGGFAMRVDTNSKLLDYVTMIALYQQPLDYLDVFQSKVEAVTAAEIKDAFQRRVKPELFQTVTVGVK